MDGTSAKTAATVRRRSMSGGRRHVAKSPAKPIRVIIADDHTLFRAGLARVLANDPRLELVGAAANGREAVKLALTERPDLVLMDLRMPVMTGVEATRALRRDAPEIHVLILTAYAEAGLLREALAAGASGYVAKDATPEETIAAILGLFGDKDERLARHAQLLSDRELHVLRQVAAGLPNKQIAKKLGISEKTVRNHLSRVFQKLGATNRTEAVMNAMRRSLAVF